MKYLEKYKYNMPRKGDYVILRFPTSYGYDTNFFANNIGQITKKHGGVWSYDIKFDKPWDVNKYHTTIENIKGSDIFEFSNNKEELEIYINVNKYNL